MISLELCCYARIPYEQRRAAHQGLEGDASRGLEKQKLQLRWTYTYAIGASRNYILQDVYIDVH